MGYETVGLIKRMRGLSMCTGAVSLFAGMIHNPLTLDAQIRATRSANRAVADAENGAGTGKGGCGQLKRSCSLQTAVEGQEMGGNMSIDAGIAVETWGRTVGEVRREHEGSATSEQCVSCPARTFRVVWPQYQDSTEMLERLASSTGAEHTNRGPSSWRGGYNASGAKKRPPTRTCAPSSRFLASVRTQGRR